MSRNVYEHQHMLRNIIEERRAQLYCGGKQKLRKTALYLMSGNSEQKSNYVPSYFLFAVDKKELRKSVET